MSEPVTPIDRAIEAVGGASAFRELLGIKRRLFFYIKSGKRELDADWALKLEAATKIPRHELQPRLWPAPFASGKPRRAA